MRSSILVPVLVLFSATAGAAPGLAAACALSESCPMMPRQQTHDCHDEDAPKAQYDCCEASKAPVPNHQCFRTAPPEVAMLHDGLQGAIVSILPLADHPIEVPFRATGPPLLALLCVLLI